MDPTLLVPLKKRDATVANDPARSAQKPKRPLSAFNLFYRFKRQKVLAAIARGQDEREDIARLVEAAPGLEDHPSNATQDDVSPGALNDLRRSIIRKDLEKNLLPRDTRDRTHRTNQSAMNGAMSFLELSRLMNASWKECDDFAKGVFDELSEEGRELYRKRLKEYKTSSEVTLTKAAKVTTKSSSAKQDIKSTKKRNSKKASSDDGSATTAEPARARTGHLHYNDHILASVYHNDAPAPSPVQFLGNRDLSASAQVMRMAVPGAALRTVSQDYSAPQDQEIERPPLDNGSTNDLMLRVRELEGKLEAERLRGRVRELEGLLGRQKMVEDQLRAQLEAFSRAGQVVAPVAAGGPAPRPPPEGLWSLANASMIHPAVRTSAMASAGRWHPHVMPRPHSPVHESERVGDRAQIENHAGGAPNKKQRRG